MPPKRTKMNSTVRQLTYKSVSTQTEDEDETMMILDYRKQIDNLNKKITEYEAIVLKLQDQNKILKQQNIKSSKGTNHISLGKNDLIEKITVKEKSISPDDEKRAIKGCSCKGNCGNKICGCVKKGISCDKKMCKCNSKQCRNQEVEKENATVENELSQEGQKALEKLGHLTLNQEILHASEKKRKILFKDRENLIKIEKYSASPLGTRRRLFRQDSDDTVDVSAPELNSPINHKERSNKMEIQFSHTPVANRNRRLKNEDEQLKIVVTTDEIQNKIELQSLSEQIVNTDENFLPKIPTVIHSPIDINKLKPVSPNDYIVRRRYRNNKVSPFNEEIDEKKNIEKVINSGRVPHSPKTSDNHQDLENRIKNSLLLVSNTTDNNNILDESLNPMVPKRQLPRSPISSAGNIILLNESKRFSPPKKELAVAEVDWEQHQSELIMCKICKRKFFPHRIEKHVTSCKGI